MKVLRYVRAVVLCSLFPVVCASADNDHDAIKALQELLEEAERQLEADEPQPANQRRAANYEFFNTANCAEGEQMLKRILAADPSLLAGAKKVELLHVLDAAAEPMNRRDAMPLPTDGAQADLALVGTTRGIMMWGPYTELEPGRHLVVYRFKFLDELTDQNACFVDVSSQAVTFSSRRPASKDLRPQVWNEMAIPIDAPDKMKFEFRFWGHGHSVAIDRIYVYKLSAGSNHKVSVMGAVNRTGTYSKKDRKQTVARFVDTARGNNGLADPEAFELYRRSGGKIEQVKLDPNATRKNTEVKAGDIIRIPEQQRATR